MHGLPVVSGQNLIKVLSRLGYQVVRQRGSHARLKSVTPAGEHAITVPLHEEIAMGTLNDIISKVALWNGISRDELIRMLK